MFDEYLAGENADKEQLLLFVKENPSQRAFPPMTDERLVHLTAEECSTAPD